MSIISANTIIITPLTNFLRVIKDELAKIPKMEKSTTAEERRKKDLDEIAEKYPSVDDSPSIDGTAESKTPKKVESKSPEKKQTSVTKADIIKDLKSRGVDPDINKSKEENIVQDPE